MGAVEREARGRCFSNMTLDWTYRAPAVPAGGLKREGKIHQYTYRFTKLPTPSQSHTATSLLNGHMSAGDAITVSVEPDLLAFVRGFILSLTPDEVIVGVDHELDDAGIRMRRPTLPTTAPLVFRIDKDELFSGMGRIRDNLAQMFYPEGDARRLELIVDLQRPRFTPLTGPLIPPHEPAAKIIDALNANQHEAMRKVLSAEDYALILGMPGTGKTTVIAAIILALVCAGKSVLLTSYTHSAVDNILLKLKKVDFEILRLGNLDKVRDSTVSLWVGVLTRMVQIHPDIHKFTLSAHRTPTTIEQLECQVMTPPVVATTCLTIDQ